MEEERKFSTTEIPTLEKPDERENEKVEIEVEGGR